MSSGRSQRRTGRGRQSKSSHGHAAQPTAHSHQGGAHQPPAPGSAGAQPPLLLWGGAILALVLLAFFAILFGPTIFSGASPTATPTAAASSVATTSPAPGATATSDTRNPTSTAPAATAGTGQAVGRIAFVRSDPTSSIRNLFVVNADGSSQQQVTEGFDINGALAWSPDGTSVLFHTDIDGATTIVRVTVGPDNKLVDSAQLTADIKADSVSPAWSPDGSMVAFQSKRDGPLSQVYVMNADGSNKRRLSDGSGFAGQPSWSPDSKVIAYVAGEQQTAGAQRELFSVPVEGGSPIKLTNTGGTITNPVWSPDGKAIICVQPVGDRDYRLLILDSDGSDLRTLDEGQVIRNPSFSPDGTAIAYYTVSNVGGDVTVYTFETDRVSGITKNQGDNYSPAWSPDGRMLAWASTPGGGTPHKIVIANRDGSDVKTVSSGEGDDSQPVWGDAR